MFRTKGRFASSSLSNAGEPGSAAALPLGFPRGIVGERGGVGLGDLAGERERVSLGQRLVRHAPRLRPRGVACQAFLLARQIVSVRTSARLFFACVLPRACYSGGVSATKSPVTIVESSRETSDSYTVQSTHSSELAAVKRARKTGGTVIHVLETHMTLEHWFVAIKTA